MTAVPWLFAAALCAPPEAATIYTLREPFRPVIRGQSPAVADLPDSEAARPLAPRGAPARPLPGNVAPPASSNVAPFGGTGPAPITAYQPYQPYQPAPGYGIPSYGSPQGGDPFLAPTDVPQYQVPVNPYGGPLWAFGTNGPQPYRYGWTTRADHTSMPSADASNGLGDIGINAVDLEAEYTTPLGPAWIYSFTQQFGMRWWDGPTSSRTGPGTLTNAGFSEQFYRIGWDFEVASPLNGPWSYQLAFNPSINSDFEQSITRDAWNFDGRAILFYRPNPQFMWALGAGFWDRVNDRIIPYAGVVWTPDDRWEFRLVFPEPRISFFLGTPHGVATWAYVRGEYHVEAYETELQYPFGGGYREKMEIKDWRLLVGIRKDTGRIGSFLEGGWVFDREVDFAHGTPDFDIKDGFILRAGIRY
ncbi:MAG: hypothetical protein IT428_21480 [Planctomycetaceae bacterium]|nr:hypothetical protein [Planctomycetaceae bacterium]